LIGGPTRQAIEAVLEHHMSLGAGEGQGWSLMEVKALFSKLLDIPLHDIPEDHEEITLKYIVACRSLTCM